MSSYSAPRPISETDDPTEFDSGEPTLDDYLRKRALANHFGGGSRCYVTCRDGRIVGYYAMAAGAVHTAAAPASSDATCPTPYR